MNQKSPCPPPPRSLAWCTVSLAVLLAFSATSGWAQSTASGTLSGQVTDQQGAVIVGADVKIIDVQTNTIRSTATNEVGRYTFINVPPGLYDVTVSKEGFSQAKVAAQKVDVGLSLAVN